MEVLISGVYFMPTGPLFPRFVYRWLPDMSAHIWDICQGRLNLVQPPNRGNVWDYSYPDGNGKPDVSAHFWCCCQGQAPSYCR